MLVRQYWAKVWGEVEYQGERVRVPVYGGSDHSLADAAEQARKKLPLIQKKMAGDWQALEDYQVEIREELLERLDRDNVITRNR